jgi:hypothetical protein
MGSDYNLDVVAAHEARAAAYGRYRDAAREMCDGLCRGTGLFTVSPYANVQVSTDGDGAYVEVQMWVPSSTVEIDDAP